MPGLIIFRKEIVLICETTPPAQTACGLSRLLPTDAALFREIFQNEDLCYANSWLYLLRSARNDQGKQGYKLISDGMIAALGYRDQALYIVHPTGARRFETLIDLCARIQKRHSCDIILKKIDQTLYQQLKATQLFQTRSENPFLFEEEAFPEHILHLARLFHPESEMQHQLQPFLRKVKRFERHSSLHAVHTFSWEELENNPGFQRLFGNNSNKYYSYRPVIQAACLDDYIDNQRYRTSAYYDEHDMLQGLYVSELLAPSIMGLYCAVSTKAAPGITEWMDYSFFRQLFDEGIALLYLGGSETEGVHSYVQKLLPTAPSYQMHPLLLPDKGLTLERGTLIRELS